MRLALTLGLMASLVVLVGCSTAGGRSVADVVAPDAAPAAAPTAYGSASGSRASRSRAPIAHERAPRVAVREAARPASRYERTLTSFTAPDAPALPSARPVARKVTMRSAPVAQPARALAPCPSNPAPSRSNPDCCPGGNCAVPSFNSECVGGNCAIPSFRFCK